MQTIKWSKKSPMQVPKLVSTGLIMSNGYVFALGGNNDGICERLDIGKNKW